MKFLEEIFMRSWWVILFSIFCYMFYEQGLKNRDAEYYTLYHHLLSLKSEKERELQLQNDLLMQINSQSDLAWIEMTLMKGLGVVPEGETKVYFRKR